MQRVAQIPRADWPQRLEQIGFHFHSLDEFDAPPEHPDPGRFLYWREDVAYAFSAAEIDTLYQAAFDLNAMCLEAVQYVMDKDLFARMAISPQLAALACASWENDEPTLFGRFDLTLDEAGVPKLYEFNADTPTSLIESSIAQWFWKEDVAPKCDQFNSLHEALIARWQALRAFYPQVSVLHLACIFDSQEDICNVEYLMDTAIQAGWPVKLINMEDIGVGTDKAGKTVFIDADNRVLELVFKLFPWEWMATSDYSNQLILSATRWVEPPWKAILSNKAILPILWEMFPNHPHLLAASFEAADFANKAHAKKPFLSREGCNISLFTQDGCVEQPGDYGAEGFIYQAYAPAVAHAGVHATLGVWIVDDVPCGLCVREQPGLIAKNTSFFVPHYFTP